MADTVDLNALTWREIAELCPIPNVSLKDDLADDPKIVGGDLTVETTEMDFIFHHPGFDDGGILVVPKNEADRRPETDRITFDTG